MFQSAKGKQGKGAVLAIVKEVKATERDYLLGHKRIYMNKQLEDVLNKALYQFFKVKNEKAAKIQKQVKAFVFRRKIFRNLKVLVKRIRIWRKFELKQRKKILSEALGNISKYAKQRKEM